VEPNDPLLSRYDETPYRDQFFPQLDLSRLLGLAQLFQSQSPDPTDLRVLDLCCASGTHVREQAARYPGVRFTGIDFSRREIETGRRRITEAGLGNVELVESDLREFEVCPGDYDLILCHGAFSWVPDEVKQRILEVCREGLKRTGVAAISYLTYPGWKQREAIRELLVSRVQGIAEPEERVRQSALLLRLLREGYAANQENVHAASLKAIVESMQQSSSNVFLHDELGVEHDPCYFMQFAEWAAESGLQYLAETDLGTMAIGGLASGAGGLLQELAPDFLEAQQLVDFLVNRSGRSSLLVRQDAPIARKLSPDRLATLRFTTEFCNTRPADAPHGSPDRFESLQGRTVKVEEPAQKRLVMHLSRAAPEALSCAALEEAEEDLSSEELRRAMAVLLSRGVVDPRIAIEPTKTEPPRV
jgi:SAM-dependent methyltransferase